MSPGDTDSVSVEKLHRELTEMDPIEDGGPEHRSEAIVESMKRQLFPEQSFQFDEDLVKNSLEELLLVLVAHRQEDTHGKGLMEDLSRLFDARLSPGTVYPRLHELEEQELLQMHELVRTKEYRVGDSEKARERIEAEMRQHLALGLTFYAALEEL
jgi:DNA-binding PadR family transcriptional regulator